MSAAKGVGDQSKTGPVKDAKPLKSAMAAAQHQKEWFKNAQERVRAGEPFCLANADTPHEIFLAMDDIPIVMMQWWSAIISAKQLSGYYFDRMGDKGYQKNVCRYCALPLACAIEQDPEHEPWGGLPKPTLLLAQLSCDVHTKVFELLARAYNCHFFPFEYPAPAPSYPRWWERLEDDWEEVIGSHVLDLRVEETKALIRYLEVSTGRQFSHKTLLEIMELENEQEEYFKKIRNLIAETRPCPVSLRDQLAATMNLQWHRGTQWAVDHTRMFYEEVKEKADKGEAVCKDEKIRLMWIGRGLWHNTAFYQYFEEKYGAVFTNSMYLSIAADGYIRHHHGDPLRALASRHIYMGYCLRDPEWQLNEAKRYGVNGAVMIVASNCIDSVGNMFIKMVLEQGGVPVLPIYADVVDAREWKDEEIKAQVSQFIEERCMP
ncbi:MAG: 2-hydroxyacyl-CoA dehydratase [Deltaproteobacteria bacterium]|nr:2-hydroxyacyl-CoA dehydratase [Deltaproteobacteria bacterium]